MRTPLDEFTKLLENPSHDLSVDVYNGNKKIKETGVKRHKPKYTINEIGNALFEFIKTTNKRFDRIETRLDGIDTRLDYIVKENNLKDSR